MGGTCNERTGQEPLLRIMTALAPRSGPRPQLQRRKRRFLQVNSLLACLSSRITSLSRTLHSPPRLHSRACAEDGPRLSGA